MRTLIDQSFEETQPETREQFEERQELAREMQEQEARGWPGDGSGEDDFADMNANEADDYWDE